MNIKPIRAIDFRGAPLKILEFGDVSRGADPRANTFIIKGTIAGMMMMMNKVSLDILYNREQGRKQINGDITRDTNRFPVASSSKKNLRICQADLAGAIRDGIVAQGDLARYLQGDDCGCPQYFPLLAGNLPLFFGSSLTMKRISRVVKVINSWLACTACSMAYTSTGKWVPNYRSLTCFQFTKMNFEFIPDSKFLWILPYPIIDILKTSFCNDPQTNPLYYHENRVKWRQLLDLFEVARAEFRNDVVLGKSEESLNGHREMTLSSAIGYVCDKKYLSIDDRVHKTLKDFLPKRFNYKIFCKY